ncbi:hypothetical protein NDU88_006562 [Pleurodeles waltl]|uniref:Uncharacterized protein n=1 Tax=Pleurodeles waltl TaxID=8319 RepID=A0AAV7ULD0_PLEWA|nr:hypothetical protein NDU88_006562 [Pleurodeles waltl]
MGPTGEPALPLPSGLCQLLLHTKHQSPRAQVTMRDIVALWEGAVTDIKGLKKDIKDHDNLVAMLETGEDAQEEELESHRCELVELRGQNVDLQLYVEEQIVISYQY